MTGQPCWASSALTLLVVPLPKAPSIDGGDAEPGQRALQVADVLALGAAARGRESRRKGACAWLRGAVAPVRPPRSAQARRRAHAIRDLGLSEPIGSRNWCTAASCASPASWARTPTDSLSCVSDRMLKVKLPDGSELELEDGATGADAAAAIGSGLAKAALAIKVDGELRDLSSPLTGGETDRDRHRPQPGGARADPPRRGARARRVGARSLARRQDLDRSSDRERLLLRHRVPGRRPRRGGSRPDRGADGRAREGRRVVSSAASFPRRRRSSSSATRARTTRSS